WERLGLLIEGRSSIYETEPVDYLAQPWFLNCVIAVTSDCTPQNLLENCQRVEKEMGRVRNLPKGPRIIDVDVLLMGTQIVNEPELVIPHPGLAVRRFVLEPLAEIAGEVVHPVLHHTVAELLAVCPDTSVVRKL
ncbi:MAG TPA: 2-amino-4-hydroxy-6-hydroxymethyldihydropteridine diphosphokinase, partial [Acidobacteriota bacterium]|nr:2-amino-4-hydroxy-6-hydroxymethyldihydropteridine diphosphokinase [Acidobacteriota bacterium]